MSDGPVEPAAVGAGDDASADYAPDHADEPDDVRALRKEAAGYRTRLRAAESERDALAGRVETLTRGEAERLASDRLTAPGDLWLAGVELPELLGEDGALDAARVTAAVDRVLESRPHWRRQQFTVVGAMQGARRPVPPAAGTDLAAVIREAVR